MRQIKRHERETTLTGFRANYTLAEIGEQCGCSATAVFYALNDIGEGKRPPIYLYVNRNDKITYAFEKEIRPVFGFERT